MFNVMDGEGRAWLPNGDRWKGGAPRSQPENEGMKETGV